MRIPYAQTFGLALAVAAAMLLAGCDPIINIAGANFPAWLFCSICGAVLTFAVRPIFVVARLEDYLWPLPIVYTSLMILLSCLMWLIFFNRV